MPARTPVFSSVQWKVREPNELAEKFGKAFAEAFSETILPEGHQLFTPDQAPLYVTSRTWQVDDTLSSSQHAAESPTYLLERMLDDTFWNDGATLLFIEGPVGCGKSTLMGYYLRCYCPTLSEKRSKFRFKLIVNADFRSVPSPHEFDKKLYREMKKRILEDYPDIEIDENYAMWESVFGFDSAPLRSKYGDTTSSTFRGDLVAQNSSRVPDWKWINGALALLSKQFREGRCRFEKLVVCLDNLDQSDHAVWRQAMWRAREFLVSQPGFWRILVPIRPTTFFDVLSNQVPLPGYDVLTIAPPDLDELFKSRDQNLMKAIEAGSSDIETGKKELIVAFVRECRFWAADTFHTLLAQICNGSTRHVIDLWKSTMSNKALFDTYVYRRQDKAVALPIAYYSLVDAMLRGPYRFFNAPHHYLPNLFAMTGSSGNARDLLIGPHTLALLGASNDSLMLRNNLRSLGYEGESIDRVLLRFKIMRLYDPTRDNQIVTHLPAIRALWDLMMQRAYIENAALVTPLPEAIRPRIQFDSSKNQEGFVLRCNTGLSFLLQIHKDESEFCMANEETAPREASSFIRALKATKIQSVFWKATTDYKQAIEGLRDRRFYKNLSAKQWEELLRHPAFELLASAKEFLEPPNIETAVGGGKTK